MWSRSIRWARVAGGLVVALVLSTEAHANHCKGPVVLFTPGFQGRMYTTASVRPDGAEEWISEPRVSAFTGGGASLGACMLEGGARVGGFLALDTITVVPDVELHAPIGLTFSLHPSESSAVGLGFGVELVGVMPEYEPTGAGDRSRVIGLLGIPAEGRGLARESWVVHFLQLGIQVGG